MRSSTTPPHRSRGDKVKITGVTVTALADPARNSQACDSSQEVVLVQVHTDEGLTGIGDVDASATAISGMLATPSAHSFSFGLRDLLIGEDPLDGRRLWHRLYEGSLMNGRRGLGMHALGALDIALWDLRGKIANQPIWKLLGGALQPAVTPYASVLPVGTPGIDIDANTAERVHAMVAAGYRAIKVEPVPQVTTTDDKTVIAMVRAAREAAGPEMSLSIDVGYRWFDARTAARCLRELEEFDLFFVETPLHFDNIEGIAELASLTSTHLAYGEIQASRYEFLDLMDRGRVSIVQPDVPRCGGLTEAIRIAEAAQDRGRLVVPHAWCSGITTAAAVHLAAVSSNCALIEYLPPELSGSELRRNLLQVEPTPVNGLIALPQGPGLGIELDPAAVDRYTVAVLS
jgi:L-alanine-DL-glutamate epimerase-like enolase superfamily enzyme